MSLSHLSRLTVPIEIIDQIGNHQGIATGFFLKISPELTVIVTNWHVVTGRNIAEPRLSNGAIPVLLKVKLHKKIIDGENTFISLSEKITIDVPINDLDGEDPRWWEHPKLGSKVDVVCIPIEYRDDIANTDIVSYKFERKYKLQVGDDVFVIGYPWGLHGGDPVLPIHKRGSIASEPTVPFLGLPRFLIDCRTAKGLSGAPVIGVHRGFWSASGKIDRESLFGKIENFAGIYSGRLHPKDGGSDFTSEIGYVWNPNIAIAICLAKKTGTKISDM